VAVLLERVESDDASGSALSWTRLPAVAGCCSFCCSLIGLIACLSSRRALLDAGTTSTRCPIVEWSAA